MHWLLVRLMSWYDEPSHLEAIEQARAKDRRAAQLLRESAMRADFIRAERRLRGR